MAGVARFELATNGLTVRCATAAPHPIPFVRIIIYKYYPRFCLAINLGGYIVHPRKVLKLRQGEVGLKIIPDSDDRVFGVCNGI